jgi:hypothetical protein
MAGLEQRDKLRSNTVMSIDAKDLEHEESSTVDD